MFLLSTTKTKNNLFSMEQDRTCPMGANYELIRSLGIVKHKKRQEFLDKMISGIIKSRSVLFPEIADKMDVSIKVESVERRIQDFFQKVEIDFEKLLLYFLCFVHHDRLQLSIDRTEWDFGKTQVNILCVLVSIGKMGVPLYFEMLDNNSGNSNADQRIELFKTIIESIGIHRIEVVIMDREFIGNKWLKWLKTKEVKFCVRVPKHHKILLPNGQYIRAEQYWKEHGYGLFENVVIDGVIVNCSISTDANGELLFLIGTIDAKNLKKTYKKRWTIEVFFQALKGRGFHIETSRLKCLKKYKKLFAIVSMAYTLCWAVGIENGKQNPVKTKNHGYPQFSVFRRGLNMIRKFYKQQIVKPILNIFYLARLRLSMLYKTIG